MSRAKWPLRAAGDNGDDGDGGDDGDEGDGGDDGDDGDDGDGGDDCDGGDGGDNRDGGDDDSDVSAVFSIRYHVSTVLETLNCFTLSASR